MLRRRKPALLVSAILFAAVAVVGARQDVAPTVSFGGAVAHPGRLAPSLTLGLPQYHRLVKVAGPNGSYRASMEVKGYALKDVLDKFEVKKSTNDGFNRPLDTFIVVKGRDGSRVLFSYGEIYFAADGGPLLVPDARLLLPHHHRPLDAGMNDPTLFRSVAERGNISLQKCNSCHAGPKPPAVSVPKGWLLVVPQDGFGGRFVEDVSDISVRQVGVAVKENREKARSVVVEEPVLVGPDGKQVTLTRERFAQAPQRSFTDASFGMGTGFHGHNTSIGVELGALLLPLLPPGSDPRKAWILVTAEDGYRSLYSGTEVFSAPAGRTVLLADRVNGEALGSGSGRYHLVPTNDFYVDRDVRQVKEIGIGLLQ